MTDWVGLVPSRGHSWKVARLAEECAKTARASYVLHFGFDADDDYEANIKAADGCLWEVETRKSLTGWTNALAARHLDVPYLLSIGDDMIPQTDGWDERLITAIEHQGGGFAYPYDARRSDIPECCMVDTRIVRALTYEDEGGMERNWFALPTSTHWFIDNVWGDLGRPDRITFLPDVTVRHLHPNVAGGDPHDQTYQDAAGQLNRDMAAYHRWRLYEMAADRETVRQACSAPLA